MRPSLRPALALSVGLAACAVAATDTGALSPASTPAAAPAASFAVRMADSVMTRDPNPLTLDAEKPKWEYTQGLVLKGIFAVGERTGDPRYFDYAKRYYDEMIGADGAIRTYQLSEYNIDRINPGKALFSLYERTKDEKYRKALTLLRRQMKEHPRTKEGGFWHKQRYPFQMWLDGLYMGAPFLAQYARVYNEPALLDDVVNQFVWMEKHARDARTGLLYHGYDESRAQKWADPATGLSKEFWGRAMGWYAMGLVDTLDFIPADHPRRGELVAILGRLAAAVEKVQDPKTGVFWQVLDKGSRPGNYLESSASTMFAYAFMKGARQGSLDARFGALGRKIHEGVIKEFITTDEKGVMSIHRVCQVAGLGGDPNGGFFRDGTFEYYVNEKIRSNDPKAVGPFILAALEYESAGK
jgi:unsaturated rhamnogalacturonyl hydrolase